MSAVRDERGFTIIEVMAATFIIAVAFLGLASVHVTSSRAHSLGVNQTSAAMVATACSASARSGSTRRQTPSRRAAVA